MKVIKNGMSDFITSMNITTNIYHDINTMELQEGMYVSKNKGYHSNFRSS